MALVGDILDDTGGPQLVEMIHGETPPRGHAVALVDADLTKLSALHFAPITARRCEVERDQAKVLRRIREAAAMSSDDFYYSFPVRTKGGGRDYIEGISIDGAMAAMQAYGNCEVDVRPIDIGAAWVFLARFIDHERGTSLIRPFLQRKQGGSRLGGDDEGRRLEIAFSVGASKAARNVIANAIRPFTNYCFQESKNDLVKRVGMDLPKHRDRAVARLAELGVDLKRVEALTGRVVADWTAREVAAVIVQVRTVQQGLATPNDIWPPEVPAEPRRSDAPPAQAATPTPATGEIPPADPARCRLATRRATRPKNGARPSGPCPPTWSARTPS